MKIWAIYIYSWNRWLSKNFITKFLLQWDSLIWNIIKLNARVLRDIIYTFTKRNIQLPGPIKREIDAWDSRKYFVSYFCNLLCNCISLAGVQTAISKCIREINQMPVNDKRCHNVEKPRLPSPLRCNDHPCAARYLYIKKKNCNPTVFRLQLILCSTINSYRIFLNGKSRTSQSLIVE